MRTALAHLQPLCGFCVMAVEFISGAIVMGNEFSLGREGPTFYRASPSCGDEQRIFALIAPQGRGVSGLFCRGVSRR